MGRGMQRLRLKDPFSSIQLGDDKLSNLNFKLQLCLNWEGGRTVLVFGGSGGRKPLMPTNAENIQIQIQKQKKKKKVYCEKISKLLVSFEKPPEMKL